ncbi:hypothetical protein [Haladaptatus sp. CMAA 1911]|uniref:hypothetical protein n=1 Tax=unclassified Haladaptatus TaxID=2622732 RepID=UPI003753FE55
MTYCSRAIRTRTVTHNPSKPMSAAWGRPLPDGSGGTEWDDMGRDVSVRSAVARTVRQRRLSRGSSEDEPRRVNARGRPPVPVADARES